MPAVPVEPAPGAVTVSTRHPAIDLACAGMSYVALSAMWCVGFRARGPCSSQCEDPCGRQDRRFR